MDDINMDDIKFFQAIKQGFWIVVKNPITLILMLLFLGTLSLLREAIFSLLVPLPEITEVILRNFIEWFYFILYSGVIIKSISNLTQGLKGATAFLKGIKTVVRKMITLTIAPFLLFLILFSIMLVTGLILFFLGIIGIPIIPSIILIVGFIFIPLFLAIRYFYYNYAILIDNETAIDSLKISWQLVGFSNWIKTFGIIVCFVVIMIIFLFIFEFLPENIILNIISSLILFIIAIILHSILVIAYLQMR